MGQASGVTVTDGQTCGEIATSKCATEAGLAPSAAANPTVVSSMAMT